jgi:hypothetical protein
MFGDRDLAAPWRGAVQFEASPDNLDFSRLYASRDAKTNGTMDRSCALPTGVRPGFQHRARGTRLVGAIVAIA